MQLFVGTAILLFLAFCAVALTYWLHKDQRNNRPGMVVAAGVAFFAALYVALLLTVLLTWVASGMSIHQWSRDHIIWFMQSLWEPFIWIWQRLT